MSESWSGLLVAGLGVAAILIAVLLEQRRVRGGRDVVAVPVEWDPLDLVRAGQSERAEPEPVGMGL